MPEQNIRSWAEQVKNFKEEQMEKWVARREKQKPVQLPRPERQVLLDNLSIQEIDELKSGSETDYWVACCLYDDVHRGEQERWWGPGGGHGGHESEAMAYCTRFVESPFICHEFWVCNYPIPAYSSSPSAVLIAILRLNELESSNPEFYGRVKSSVGKILWNYSSKEIRRLALNICKAILYSRLESEIKSLHPQKLG